MRIDEDDLDIEGGEVKSRVFLPPKYVIINLTVTNYDSSFDSRFDSPKYNHQLLHNCNIAPPQTFFFTTKLLSVVIFIVRFFHAQHTGNRHR